MKKRTGSGEPERERDRDPGRAADQRRQTHQNEREQHERPNGAPGREGVQRLLGHRAARRRAQPAALEAHVVARPERRECVGIGRGDNDRCRCARPRLVEKHSKRPAGGEQTGGGGERAVQRRDRMDVDERADGDSGHDPVAALPAPAGKEREQRRPEYRGDEERVHPGEGGEREAERRDGEQERRQEPDRLAGQLAREHRRRRRATRGRTRVRAAEALRFLPVRRASRARRRSAAVRRRDRGTRR